ncbi:MAG TPA: alcohol dehydrogenase catalytic domain-containing protein [Gaiellaceae bacterium]|nr:alcohol dehydrogenase catalytic domain-containing protein [Gaiellaceae bacterium]
MRAVVLACVGDVQVEHVADARVEADTDAVVQVRATAICGADLFPFHGMTPGFELGTTMGHEFAGVVVEAGPAVASFQVGDRVACTSTISDGTCAHCRAGRASQCLGRSLFGYSGVYPRLEGGQAEYVRVPHAERCLLRLPEEVDDESAIFLADNLPTGYGAVTRGGVAEGDTVVVVGCGPVGLMAILCADGLAGTLLAVDGVPERRRLAEQLGARALAPDEAADAVSQATDGLGADVVIEAAGSPGALDLALRLARGRGTVSVVGAHFEPDYDLDNGLMFEHELTMRFTIGDCARDRWGLLESIAAGTLDPAQIISHRMPLGDAAEAYRLFDSREATKVVLTP